MTISVRIGVVVCLAAAPILRAQPPDFYKSVERLTWVVDDLDKVVAGWRQIGVPLAGEPATRECRENRVRGRAAPLRFRMARGAFQNVRADWLQPVGDAGAFTDFLKEHGAGVFSLMHQAPSLAAFRSERKRLEDLGVPVLQEGVCDFEGARVEYAYFDTLREGKYALGLVWLSEPEKAAAGSGPAVTQYAFVARDLDTVSRFWQKLGLPAFTFTHPEISDKVYRGKPGDFDMRLGWQRHGKVPYEWIEPLRGPSVYHEHLAKHGEGLHHVAFQVTDMDEGIRRWEDLGFALSMGGGWGQRGAAGSGRFAYHDTHSIGGTDIELLWNFKK